MTKILRDLPSSADSDNPPPAACRWILSGGQLVPNTIRNGSPSLSDSIIGDWVTHQYGVYIVFQDDGTYGVGYSLESATPSVTSTAELEWGTWSTDGSVLTQTLDGRFDSCTAVGTYEIDVLEDGNRLDVTVLDDDCPTRRSDFGSGLTRHIDAGS